MSVKESSLSTLICRVLIVGGGLCGVATAIALRKSGHEVVVFERMPKPVPFGAGIQLSPNCTRLFRHWGILEKVAQAAYQPNEGRLRSYKGHTLSKQDSGASIEANYKAPYLVIHRADLLDTLISEAQELGVEIKYASVVTSIGFEQGLIKLISGEVFIGDVVLGADGERSICRDAILQHPDIPFPNGDTVFRLAISGKELPQTEEILSLTKPPSVNLWLGPESHAVTYSLKKDDIFNVVLVCRDNPDAQVMYGPQPADRIELQSKFAQWEPLFGDLLKVEKAMLMKWSLLQINEVKEWCHPSGKFALIGDAAHAMLPYLAQGGAQAFEDAAILGTLFSAITDVSQIPAALRVYEKIRKPRTSAIRKQTVAQKAMYEMVDGPRQEARDKQFAEPGNSPDCLENPEFQSWLWGYDAVSDAKRGWNDYLSS